MILLLPSVIVFAVTPLLKVADLVAGYFKITTPLPPPDTLCPLAPVPVGSCGGPPMPTYTGIAVPELTEVVPVRMPPAPPPPPPAELFA